MTMTYYGTTATSTSRNPPCLLYAVLGGQIPYSGDLSTGVRGGKVWFYSSTNHATDLDAAGSIPDGGVLGMRPGDILLGVVTGIAGSALSTDMFPYMAVLNSTESSLSTAAYNITSNFST